MRYALVIFFLVLHACRTNDSVQTLEQQFHAARDLTQKEQFAASMRASEAGERAAGTNIELLWRFRLLQIEALLGQGYFQQALTMLDGYGEISGPALDENRGRAAMLRASAFSALNRIEEAQKQIEVAVASAQKANSNLLAAEVNLRLGGIEEKQRHFEAARLAYNGTVITAVQAGDGLLEAHAAESIGVSFYRESKYDEAIPWFERAARQFKALGASDPAAAMDGDLGLCYFRLADYDNAQQYLQGARDYFAGTGSVFQEQRWSGNLSSLLMDRKDYAAAAVAARRALDLARQLQDKDRTALWLGNLATISIELGQWDEAERYNNEALSLNKTSHADLLEPVLNSARIAVGRQKFSEAESIFRQVLAGQSENLTLAMAAHMGLADIYARRSKISEADAEYRTTLAEIDRRALGLNKDDYKLTYLDFLMVFQREYVDFLMANNQSERALEVVEASRARVLAGKTGKSAALAPVPPARYRQLARDAQATLLEYWLGEKQSYLWVITPEQIRVQMLPPSGTLHPLIASYHAIVMGGRDPLRVAPDTGRKLFETLVKPALGEKSQRFVIVPDGDLYTFNFETLPADDRASQYWLQQATVEIAPSLAYMTESKRSHLKNGLLLMGDPEASTPQFPRLEFAGQEMASVNASLKTAPATVLSGPGARPDSYFSAQPGGFGFIHFAAHAAANQQSPLDSAVILSGIGDKGKLLARNVMSVPLAAQLVTISACRSAGGKAYAGEGLIGFAWAFLRAGAGNVIAGLWDVSDRSTALVMDRLYKGIAAGMPIPDALRAAKLQLIERGGAYAKPFYWAPFQLYAGTYQ